MLWSRRLPTAQEIGWLINYTGAITSTHNGTANGTYTGSNTWVSGLGANKGFKVTTKALNGATAGQVLWFPTAGFRIANGATYDVGSGGLYWSSGQSDATNAYYLYFTSSYPAGHLSYYSKLGGFPVRCVRL